MRRTRHGRARLAGSFPSLSRRLESSPNFHMFVEDVYNGVLPIGGHSESHPEFSVSFEGTDQNKALELLGSLSEFEHHDPTGLVCDAVNQVALGLAWHGRAVYEMVQDANEPSLISLYSCTTERLFKLSLFYIQFVPVPERERFGKRVIVVPSEKVWEIIMPAILGGRRGYLRMLSKLNRLGSVGPPFLLADLEAQRQTVGFDLKEYSVNQEICKARWTRLWGWNRRDASSKFDTQFFYIYRTITFCWAQAVLREHVISNLNTLFERLRIKSRIVLSGLPSPNDINVIRRGMVEGNIKFAEGLSKASVY